MRLAYKIEENMIKGKLLQKILELAKNLPLLTWNTLTYNIPVAIKKVDKLLARPVIKAIRLLTPIDPNKIFVCVTRGEYECNAKWIVNELLSSGSEYDIVWTVRKNCISEIPAGVRVVQRGSLQFYHEISSAKLLIENSINFAYLLYKKKKSQILMETWHGAIGIKKFSASCNKDKKWVKLAYKQGADTDYCLSNSSFEDEVFREDFWKKATILRYGHARNDILFEKNTERINVIREKIWKYFNLSDDCRICLYAPTFRENTSIKPYNIDYAAVKNALHEKFGGEWVIMTRYHFKIQKIMKRYKLPSFVIDASRYPDIQELMVFTECAITDYSSWICEYMNTRRPGFLFATDLTEFEHTDREFFYPLDSMPFPLATSSSELIENILQFDNKEFVNKCDEFLNKYGCIDDGHAAKRTVDKIREIMKGEVSQ